MRRAVLNRFGILETTTEHHQVTIDVPEHDSGDSQNGDSSPTSHNLHKNVTWNSNIGEQQMRQERMFRGSVSVPNFAVLRSARHHRKVASFHDMENCGPEGLMDTPEQSVFLTYAPAPTVWPMISWPTEFWLLAATFLFAGLETTYGAFLHSFALRTLHWTPVSVDYV